jgi:hypothetical protein
MPEQYVQTRINLLTALREIDRETKLVSVNIHVITPEDNASATAEKYGVENQNGVTPPLFRHGRWTHGALAKGFLHGCGLQGR